MQNLSRREALQTVLLSAGAGFLGCSPALQKKAEFTFCLNTSTINSQKLGLVESMEIAARAGYDAVEIWVRDLDAYLKTGGGTGEIRRRAQALGLTIENAIDFPRWIVDDPSERRAALEQARRSMALLAEIGCPRIAAPPVGATFEPKIDLFAAAERFAALLEIGEAVGVIPQLEIWGFSANLHTMGEALLIAAESGHPRAGILADVYHLYRGGSPFESLHYAPASSLQILHMNDYPAAVSRNALTDADRLLPGDGAAPWSIIMQLLRKKTPIILSLELFRRDLWEQDPLQVAETGLAKMKAAVSS